jgi:hypothetical protein
MGCATLGVTMLEVWQPLQQQVRSTQHALELEVVAGTLSI